MARTVRKRIRVLGVLLFGLYLAALIYFLFFAESYGRSGIGAYSYNICPFREIRRFLTYREILGTKAVFLNLAGNVIGFLPFGALLPLLARGSRRAWRITALSFSFSALVELSQLIFRVGCFDVDDIILNTCGGLLGYLLFCVLSRIYLQIEKSCKRKHRRSNHGKKTGLFI